MINKVIVISGINLTEGGPLSVFFDFLDEIIKKKIDADNKIVAFVHKKEIFRKYSKSNIEFIELPKAKKNYLFRMYYEYFFFKRFSKRCTIDYWISLHDITPNVKAINKIVYCHNPSPFRKISLFDLKMGIKNVLFPLFYGLVYKKNIKKNKYVIVQQDWIKNEFIKRYKISNVIVAYPSHKNVYEAQNDCEAKETTFFYPAFPRVFKNFEIILESVKILNQMSKTLNFKVIITIDGTENKYSKYLFRKYNKIKNVKWVGVIPREEVFEYYKESSALIFPSKIETWGLPISEFKATNKPIFLIDLPYARETVGNYDKICFFNPNDVKELANKMEIFINDPLSIRFDNNCSERNNGLHADNWSELLDIIFANHPNLPKEG